MIDMEKYLGRCIQVYLINGTAIYFKPMEYNSDFEYWIGWDEEGRARTISRGTIDAIIF